MAIARLQGSIVATSSTTFSQSDEIHNASYDSGGGSNRALIVTLTAMGRSSESAFLSDNVTFGVSQYGGNDLVLLDQISDTGTRRVTTSVFQLADAPTGSNTLSIFVEGDGSSYDIGVQVWTGADLAALVNAFDTDERSATSPILSMLTDFGDVAIGMVGAWQGGDHTATIDGVYTERHNDVTGTSTTQDNGTIIGDRIVAQ